MQYKCGSVAGRFQRGACKPRKNAQLIPLSKAVQYLPYGVVYNLALSGQVVDGDCIIFLRNGDSRLRLQPVFHTVPMAYEEVVGQYGTNFKLLFIIYKGAICRIGQFRMSPYADTIAHSVIDTCARFVY